MEPEKTTEAPIKHDGWKSRRFVGGSLMTIALLAIVVGVFYVSGGKPKADQFFSETYFMYGLLLSSVVFMVSQGLLSVDKVLELIKLKMSK